MGRVPSIRYGPRLMDLDILLYGDLVLRLPDLEIPHPRMSERAFVLVPLAEIDGDLRHPVTGQTMAEMAALVEKTGVEKFTPQARTNGD